MRLPRARGPLLERLIAAMRGTAGVPRADIVEGDEDRQLSLWVLYEQHYRGFDEVDDRLEWDPRLLAVRAQLEEAFEGELRSLARPMLQPRDDDPSDVVDQLQAIVTAVTGPSLATFLHREATLDQYREFLVHRSIYHLKESDPHAWAIPRLQGAPKVALAELQYDEYGAGRPGELHSTLFGDALEAAGLDRGYGAYLDSVPGYTLAVSNAMSLFGLHRRLRGAGLGHLAAFEMTSSLPCRRYSQGADRLGFGDRVLKYFDEHVEADAVHEHIAARDICQRLVDEEPQLCADVLLGAVTCVQLDALAARHMLRSWESAGSSLIGHYERNVA